jgi:transposase
MPQWIADLLSYGLLRPSFVPPAPQRELRELTRYRMSLSEEHARLINRLQKTLEDANLKLASVASDVMGRSARDMLSALLAGEVNPAILADLARGRLRSKRELLAQALQGQLKPHHGFLLSEQLADIDAVEEAIERVSTEIATRIRPYEPQIQRLSTIPGIKRRLAEVLLAEIGPNVSRFPDARPSRLVGGYVSRQQRKWGQTLEWEDAQGQSLAPLCLSRGCSCRHPCQRLLPLCPVSAACPAPRRQEGDDCRRTHAVGHDLSPPQR